MKKKKRRDDEGESRQTNEVTRNERTEIKDFIFTFEVLQQYPHVRSFIMKKPLKKHIGEAFMELFDGSKKRATI